METWSTWKRCALSHVRDLLRRVPPLTRVASEEWECWVSFPVLALFASESTQGPTMPVVLPPDSMVAVLVVVLPLTWARQSHDGRAGAEILDRAHPDNARVPGTEANRHVSHRGREVNTATTVRRFVDIATPRIPIRLR